LLPNIFISFSFEGFFVRHRLSRVRSRNFGDGQMQVHRE